MANIATVPDEIIELILQSIYDDDELLFDSRDSAFLNIVQVLPNWIQILLDSCFLNGHGQRSARYEQIWAYRHRVYLDEQSGEWRVRGVEWQPHGTKTTGWRCRNGDSSHVGVERQEIEMDCVGFSNTGHLESDAMSDSVVNPLTDPIKSKKRKRKFGTRL